jgi:hypothetical protein
MADRARRFERGWRQRHGITDAATRLVGARGGVAEVSAGPFAGMRYPVDRLADVDTPVGKLMGVYEVEIYAPFEKAIAGGTETFIDIGCADGYYAVGMPYASPKITTHAFDLAKSANHLCREVAQLNDLGRRVRIGRRFSIKTLDRIAPEGALMLCDIEGAEADLFGRALVGRLAATTVVIEVHEDVRPGIGAALRSLFEASHEVEFVTQRPVADDPAVAENRSPLVRWLVATPSAA